MELEIYSIKVRGQKKHKWFLRELEECGQYTEVEYPTKNEALEAKKHVLEMNQDYQDSNKPNQ